MIEIYANETCSRCKALKNNLKPKGIEFEYLLHDQDYTKDDLIERTGRNSFNLPVAFKDGEEITYIEALSLHK